MGCRWRGRGGWYLGPGNWLLRLLGAKLLHGVIVFLLLLCHEDVFPSKVQWDGARKVGGSPSLASRTPLPQTSPVKRPPSQPGGLVGRGKQACLEGQRWGFKEAGKGTEGSREGAGG